MSVLQTYTQVAPAAGADLTWTVPTTVPQSGIKVVSMRLQLVTSAAVANRRPRFTFTDDSAAPLEFWRQAVGTDQPASQTVVYTVAPGQGSTLQGGAIGVAIPGDLWLSAGFAFKTSTLLIDTADQWSSLTVVVIAE